MPQPWWQRRSARAALVAFALLDLVVLGTDAYLLKNRSVTTEVDLQDALDAFHDGGDPATSTSSGSSAPAGGAEDPGAAVTEPSSAPTAAPATAPAPMSSAPVPTSAPATPKAGALAPPQAGVYRYRTTGGESVSVLGSRHAYPAETYATVRTTGGCGWELRAEVVKEHVDRRTMCSEGDHVDQLEQQRAVTFFGTTDGATMECTPPQVQYTLGDAPGATASSSCTDGKGSDAKMTRTTIAFGTATVGGAKVATVTYRVDGIMTGRVRGTSTDRYTVVLATGLPISIDRSVDTMADAFGTSVRYQEHATFDLVSLHPET